MSPLHRVGRRVSAGRVPRRVPRALLVLTLAATWGPAAGAAGTPPDGWRIRIEAAAPGLLDRGGLVLGATSAAVDGLDPFDEPHPPALPKARLDVVTRHVVSEPGWESQVRPERRYRTEYVAPVGPISRALDFFVDLSQAADVTLSWSVEPDLDLAQHYVTLRDVGGGLSADVWAQTSLVLSLPAGVRRMRLELVPGRAAPPVAFSQSVVTDEDVPTALTLLAVDAEGDPLTYSIVTPPVHGSLGGVPPHVVYVPAADFNGTDPFTFKAADAAGESNVATVFVSVLPVPDAPVAHDVTFATDEDAPLPFTLAAFDPDGDPLTFTVLSQPAHGALTGTPPDLVYTPAPDFHGSDAFTFRVSDGQFDSNVAGVSLAVRSVNDPPVADFTVAGPARNAATWENNAASLVAGADVVSASSGQGRPAIDDDPATWWQTSATTNQSLVVALAGREPRRLDALRLLNAGPSSGGAGVRNFKIEVSSAATPAAFAAVLEGQAAAGDDIQEFPLPAGTTARYVRFTALDNHGAACCIALRSLELVDRNRGGLTAFSSAGFGSPPEFAIDGKATTSWRSAAGRVAGEFLVIRLAEDEQPLVESVRLQAPAAGESLREFDVLLSAAGTTPADFTPVLSASLSNDGKPRDFVLPGGPLRARYAKLVARSNHGSPAAVQVAAFEVWTAGSDGNVITAGATVQGFSSQWNASFAPQQALDFDPAGQWVTAPNQNANQWLELALPGHETWRVDRLVLQAPAGTTSPRHFELLVSPAGTGAAGFAPVLAGTLRNDGSVQHFPFQAAAARALRLVLLDNHGGSTINVQTVRVVSSQIGTLDSRFLDRSTVIDAPLASQAWDFGDGGASASRDPAHTFAAPGDYDVTLAVSDAADLSATRTRRYRVIPAPVPSFTWTPTQPGESQLTAFTDTSTDPSGIAWREWNFADGTAVNATALPTISRSFADNGTYPVTLTVTSRSGVRRSVTRAVTAVNLPPTVTLTPQRRAVSGTDWGGSVAVSDPGVPDRASLTCEWDFGDGQGRGVGPCGAVPHVYTVSGTQAVDYTATVTVRDKDGGATSASTTVTVFPPQCAVAGGTWIEPAYCGSYTVADLGPVPQLPTRYSGLAFLPGDPDTLVIGADAIVSKGAIYKVPVERDTAGRVTGFGEAVKLLDVPEIDGGLAFGPGGVLFTARWPSDRLVQIKPGLTRIDKDVPLPNWPLPRMYGVALGFIPPQYPAACEMRAVGYFGAPWWAPALAPDGNGTYDITAVRTGAALFPGGPEHLAYVPANSPVLGGQPAVFVTEYNLGTLAVYDVDARADAIPSTRRHLSTGVPSPEALTFDPVTGDLLVTSLDTQRITAVRGFRAPAFAVTLTPSSGTLRPGETQVLTALVTDAKGAAYPGVPVELRFRSGPHAGVAADCNSADGCRTGPDGRVSFSYAGTAAGTDNVEAFFVSHFCQEVVSEPVQVRWAVNSAPTAHEQSVTTPEDTALAVTLTAGDSEGDALTFTVVAAPAHGTLSGTPPQLSYTPSADYHGTDSFTFQANDGELDSPVAGVSITVTPVNDAPTADGRTVSTHYETAVPVTLTAGDVDGDALTYVILTPPAHGSLDGSAPALLYTPAAGYHGADSFTFQAHDGSSESNVATVSVTVNAPANQPPQCDAAAPSVALLWPPNHTLRAVTVQGVTDPEGQPVSITVTAVRQDEPVDGLGDGDTAPDATLVPLQLRAERAGGGNGRVYHVAFEAHDEHGAECSGSVKVCVPHNQGSGFPCVDEGALYPSTAR